MREAGEGDQLFEGNEIFHFLTTQIRQKEKSWLFQISCSTEEQPPKGNCLMGDNGGQEDAADKGK